MQALLDLSPTKSLFGESVLKVKYLTTAIESYKLYLNWAEHQQVKLQVARIKLGKFTMFRLQQAMVANVIIYTACFIMFLY